MKNRKFLSVISVIAFVCLLFGVMSVCVFAADSVHITATLASEGEIIVPAADYEITDADGDGKITINDALIIIHQDAFADDDTAYETEVTEWGLSIKRLCGVENGGSYGYYVNNVMGTGLDQELNDGDYLYAYVFEDAATYSDKYSFFDTLYMNADVDSEFTLVLKKIDFDAGWNPVEVNVENAIIVIDGEDTEYRTDADGKVTLSLPDEGDYLISARTEGSIITPAVVLATISAPPTEPGEEHEEPGENEPAQEDIAKEPDTTGTLVTNVATPAVPNTVPIPNTGSHSFVGLVSVFALVSVAGIYFTASKKDEK